MSAAGPPEGVRPPGGSGTKGLGTVLAWTALSGAAIAGVAALLGGPGYRLGWWTFGAGIQVIRWAATAALVAVGVALVALVVSSRGDARSGQRAGLVALALGLAVAVPPLWQYQRATSLPRIHDITTDTVNPPRFVAVLPLRKGAPNSTEFDPAVAEEQKKAYPDIAPARLAVPPGQALQLAEGVARSMGWEIVAVSPDELRLEATARTLLFGFRDDVVVRVAAEGTGSRVDVRSVSRVGRSDIGTNADRVRAFVAKLKASQPGG